MLQIPREAFGRILAHLEGEVVVEVPPAGQDLLPPALAKQLGIAVRAEKMLGDFEEQAGRPFEHEARLKELLSRQAELKAALDLDKGERQIAPPAGAEGSAEVDGDAGADERAAGVTVCPERREEWRPNRRGRSDDADADDDKVVVPGRPVSGPKF